MPAIDVVASAAAAAAAEDGTTRSSSTTMSDDSNNNKIITSNKVGERARGRWKLLRKAIVRSAVTTASETTTTSTNSDDHEQHSIHSFAGYHLLPPSAPSQTRVSHVWEQLLVLQLQVGTETISTTTTAPTLLQMVLDSILALTAMDSDCRVLEFSVALLHCQDDKQEDVVDINALTLLVSLQQHCADWSLQLQRQCAWKKCDLSWRGGVVAAAAAAAEVPLLAPDASASAHGIMLRIQFEPVEIHSQYVIREYSTNTNSTNGIGGVSTNDGNGNATTKPAAIVLARERVPTRQVSLQELVSHHHQKHDNNLSTDNRGIDNTGNICVWDCEKTLAWVLLREQQETTLAAGPLIVTELGAGMVGLAGLCLVAAAANHNNDRNSSNNGSIQELYLTDGHVDSVQNNRVHVRLGQAAGGQLWLPQSSQSAPRSEPSSACRVHCSVLKWSIDSDKTENAAVAVDTTSPSPPPPPPADWTLISDCTHFEEYHAELFWTLITCTVSTGDGTIWMCQPDRGKSLDRFLDLVRAVNGGSTTSTPPLVMVQEQHYETLRTKHEELLQRDKTYDPNIHRPRVFCLRKLRAETEDDRLATIRHIQERV
jgi:hypothetical protein